MRVLISEGKATHKDTISNGIEREETKSVVYPNGHLLSRYVVQGINRVVGRDGKARRWRSGEGQQRRNIDETETPGPLQVASVPHVHTPIISK